LIVCRIRELVVGVFRLNNFHNAGFDFAVRFGGAALGCKADELKDGAGKSRSASETWSFACRPRFFIKAAAPFDES
jgi:hypothetical protein